MSNYPSLFITDDGVPRIPGTVNKGDLVLVPHKGKWVVTICVDPCSGTVAWDDFQVQLMGDSYYSMDKHQLLKTALSLVGTWYDSPREASRATDAHERKAGAA